MKKYQAGGSTKMNPSKIATGPIKPGSKEAFDKFKGAPVPKGGYKKIDPVKPPKSVRKTKPTMQPPMRKGGSMRGKAC